MPGLFDSLSIAARSLDAQRMGLDVAGQNIANVNTEGYSRRQLQLAEIPALDSRSAGRGVDVVGIRALRDKFVEARMVRERQSEQRNAAMAQVVSGVETALGRPGQSLDRSLTSYFDAFAELAQDATSTVARDQVVSQGQSLARDFNDMAERLESARVSADTEIRGVAEQVNTIAAEVARLNGKIAARTAPMSKRFAIGATCWCSSWPNWPACRYRRDRRRAGRLDRQRPPARDRQHAVCDDGGIGRSVRQRHARRSRAWTSRRDHRGRIGGLIEARDTLVPAYQARLDQLAYDFANGVNTVHRTGYDTGGGTNRDFFVPPAAVAGAARDLAVDPASSPTPGSSRRRRPARPATTRPRRRLPRCATRRLWTARPRPAEAWAQLVYRVGADGCVGAGRTEERSARDRSARTACATRYRPSRSTRRPRGS